MQKKLFVLILLFYATSTLINIGKLSFNYKEAKNAIISLQMNISNNYSWQTILGKPYFKKPPLNSYYTAFLFKIFGENESVAKIGQLFFLIFLAFVPLIFMREFLNYDSALRYTLVFLTTTLSLYIANTYTSYIAFTLFLFLAIYKIYFKNKNFAIWLILAFLIQGLLALFLFFVIVIVLAILEKNEKLISNKEHLILIISILFSSLLGIFLYGFNAGSIHYLIGSMFLGFLEEFNFKNYLFHVLSFPFEIFILLLPWSLFSKQTLKNINPLHNFALKTTLIILILLWVLPINNYFMIVPFFALLIVNDIKIDNAYFRIIMFFGAVILIFIELFGYLFIKDSNYIILPFFVLFLFAFLYFASKKYHLDHYLYIAVLLICLKASYNAIIIPYQYTYLPDMRIYGQKLASIILKNKVKYVMSNNVHLDLLYYVEKNIDLSIYIPKAGKGVLITQHKQLLRKNYGCEFSPYGVYCVGIY